MQLLNYLILATGILVLPEDFELVNKQRATMLINTTRKTHTHNKLLVLKEN